MTAAAASDDEEFKRFYDLDITVIPPNKICIRKDYTDRLLKSKEVKNKAKINEIIKVHKTRRPILVKTASVEESEFLSDQLNSKVIMCDVLNAQNDEYEAGIIAQAGKPDAVNVSTNMAGKGTDIRLGGADQKEKQQVIELGGLYVIGTNRHESVRTDNQLMGGAGRQGDPGSSRFFISLEDNLFVKYRLNDQLLLNIIEEQREILARNRDDILFNDSLIDFYRSNCPENFSRLIKNLGMKKLTEICRLISLNLIDKAWSQYLAEIADIREGIHLRRYGYKDPLAEFYKLAISIFGKLLPVIESCMIYKFNSIDANGKGIDPESLGLKATSST